MAEQKLDVVEEVVDIVGDQIEVVEKSASLIKRIVWNHKTHIGVSFIAGAGLGGFVAYKVTSEKLQTKFDALLTEEVEKAEAFYSQRNKTGDYSDPVKLAESLIAEGDEINVNPDASAKAGLEALRDYRAEDAGDIPETDVEAEEVIREEIKKSKKKSIFENSTEDFNWDEEMLKRDAAGDAEPYVITEEEFLQNEPGNENKSLTYYEGDGVLADESDNPVQDIDGTVGDDNLRFGYGSNDSNMVYVRNPRIEMDMEIVRSQGTYTKEVLGFDDEAELKHSGRRRRFRESDE
jgi:hypothetical protein